MADFNDLLALMRAKDKEYDDLFQQLEDGVDVFSEESIPLQEKARAGLQVEFIYTKLHIKASNEKQQIARLIQCYDKDITYRQLIGTFKNRITYLQELIIRILEVKGNMDSIQKYIYTYNTQIKNN